MRRDPAISGIEGLREPRDERPGPEQDTAGKDEEDLQQRATAGLDAAGRQHDMEHLLERPIRNDGGQAPALGIGVEGLEGLELKPPAEVEHTHLAHGPAAEPAVAVVQDSDPTRIGCSWLSTRTNGTGFGFAGLDQIRIGSVWLSR